MPRRSSSTQTRARRTHTTDLTQSVVASRSERQAGRFPPPARWKNSPLAPERIATVKDEDIDFSDIPELDEAFWREAELVEPDSTEQITIRVKRSVLDHFKAPGKGYQTRINRVLESYVRARAMK